MNLRHNMAIIFCDFFISRNVCISLWLCGLRHWSCKPQILSLNPLESFVKCYRNRIIFQYFPQIYLFYFLDISMYIYYIFHYKTNSFSLKKLHREKKPSLLNGYLSSLMTACGPLNSNSGSIPKTLFVKIKSQAQEYRKIFL